MYKEFFNIVMLLIAKANWWSILDADKVLRIFFFSPMILLQNKEIIQIKKKKKWTLLM